MSTLTRFSPTTPSDAHLAQLLFELAIHDAADWLDAGKRLRRGRFHRLAALAGRKPRGLPPSVEDDLWYTATIVAQILREELELSPSDISTAFDVIGLPGESVERDPRAVIASRVRLEAAVRGALIERELAAPVVDDDDDLDFESTDSIAA